MRVRFSQCAAVFICLAVLLALPAVLRASGETTIGVIHWENFAYATMMKNSYQLAAEAIDRAGGIRGKPAHLVYADDQGSRRGGEQAVDELVKEKGAILLLGGYSSSNTIYTAFAANRLKTPFLICTAADDRITKRRLRHVYRINPPAVAYANGLEDFLLEKALPTSMAIIYESSPYGTGSAMRMMWFCREHDIELTAVVPYQRERASRDYFDRVLCCLRGKTPDVLYMVSYLKDATALVATLREKQYRSLLCGGAGGFTHYKFIEKIGTAGEGLVTAALWAPETGYAGAQDYYETYQKRFGHAPDYHGAEAYSALLVAAEALNQADGLCSASIREALDRIDMETPFGPVKFTQFDGHERQNQSDCLVLQISNQKFRCIWPPRLSSGPFTPPPYWRP